MTEDERLKSISYMFANAAAEADATIKRIGYGHPRSVVAMKIIELARAVLHDERGLTELARTGSAEVGGAAAGTAFGDLLALVREFEGMKDAP